MVDLHRNPSIRSDLDDKTYIIKCIMYYTNNYMAEPKQVPCLEKIIVLMYLLVIIIPCQIVYFSIQGAL